MSVSRILSSTRCSLFTYSLGVVPWVLRASYCRRHPGFIEVCCVPGVTCVLQVQYEWAEWKLLPSRSTCPRSPTSLLMTRGQTWLPRLERIVALLILSPGLPFGIAVLTCGRVKAPTPQGGWICFYSGTLLAQPVSYHLLSHPCHLSSIIPRSSCFHPVPWVWACFLPPLLTAQDLGSVACWGSPAWLQAAAGAPPFRKQMWPWLDVKCTQWFPPMCNRKPFKWRVRLTHLLVSARSSCCFASLGSKLLLFPCTCQAVHHFMEPVLDARCFSCLGVLCAVALPTLNMASSVNPANLRTFLRDPVSSVWPTVGPQSLAHSWHQHVVLEGRKYLWVFVAPRWGTSPATTSLLWSTPGMKAQAEAPVRPSWMALALRPMGWLTKPKIKLKSPVLNWFCLVRALLALRRWLMTHSLGAYSCH